MTPIDVLRATLPAGTVSGAPKVRAMEIIDDLEPTKRGPYAGVVGYIDFSGNIDTAIAIRTMVVSARRPGGGAGRRRGRGRQRGRRRGPGVPQQGQGPAQRRARRPAHDRPASRRPPLQTGHLRARIPAISVPRFVLRLRRASLADEHDAEHRRWLRRPAHGTRPRRHRSGGGRTADPLSGRGRRELPAGPAEPGHQRAGASIDVGLVAAARADRQAGVPGSA